MCTGSRSLYSMPGPDRYPAEGPPEIRRQHFSVLDLRRPSWPHGARLGVVLALAAAASATARAVGDWRGLIHHFLVAVVEAERRNCGVVELSGDGHQRQLPYWPAAASRGRSSGLPGGWHGTLPWRNSPPVRRSDWRRAWAWTLACRPGSGTPRSQTARTETKWRTPLHQPVPWCHPPPRTRRRLTSADRRRRR